MADDKKSILFLAINPFGYIPVLRYIINHLSNWEIKIVSNYIKNSYSFSKIANEKFIDIFNNSSELSNPSKWQQIKRYSVLNYHIFRFLFKNKKNSILYSIDYQVVSIALWWKKIFPSSNAKIIYHQIEIAESKLYRGANLLLLRYFMKNAKKIDFVIIPEKNRLNYFLTKTDIEVSKTMIFPNTCIPHDNFATFRHPLIERIPEGAFVIGHIGNMGINYSYEYLTAVSELANNEVYFIFVGRQLPEITEYLLNISKINKNIICCSEIPHNELARIYPFLNVGVILYKGVDLNNEYCAPNKLYEYWSFGIPVVAHQLKGLVDVFDKTEQGVLINMSDINEILEVLKKYIANGFSDKSSLINLFVQQYAITNFLPILNQRINSLIQN